MTWTAGASTTLGFATRSNSSITKPASSAGDLIVVVLYQEDNAGTITMSEAGYTLLRRGENATPTPDLQYYAWYRVADGTEDATINTTHASSYTGAACTVFNPSNGGAALDTQAAAVTANSNDPTSIAAITAIGNNLIVICGCNNYNEEDSTYETAGWTKTAEAAGSLGGGAAIGFKTQASAGTTGACSVNFGGATGGSVGCQHTFTENAGGGGGGPVPRLALLGVG